MPVAHSYAVGTLGRVIALEPCELLFSALKYWGVPRTRVQAVDVSHSSTHVHTPNHYSVAVASAVLALLALLAKQSSKSFSLPPPPRWP